MKTVLLGITGSISAYKSADIVNLLTKLGYSVEVIMTENSTKFISPLTLQSLSKNPVHTNVMEEIYPDKIDHIDLAKKADVFVIAPASANIIGKIANGIADDLLSTVAMALKTEVPKIVAPAMNTYMYQNPAMQKNLKIMTEEYGYQEIEPREALLACGDYGKGALANIESITATVQSILAD